MRFVVSNQTLNRFGDRIVFRDPKGRSVYRSLHPVSLEQSRGILITGPFMIHTLFEISKKEGVDFVIATGDENPIHREGDIVPGAMTSARAISGIESMFPLLDVNRFKIKFKSIARYDRVMRQQLSFSFPGDGRVSVTVRTEQQGEDVAMGMIQGTLKHADDLPNIRKRKVNKEELQRVEVYFRSLNIDPALFLEPCGRQNYVYPRGFLASLPSGEMVRQFSGEGGILSSLELGYQDGILPPITGSRIPRVSLKTARSRPRFSKIMTWIKSGIEECCKGFALVFVPKIKLAPDKE